VRKRSFVLAILAFGVTISACLLPSAADVAVRNELASSTSAAVRAVMQATLNHPEIEEYFHVEVLPERKPLVLLKNSYFESEPPLKKFGLPVVYATEAELRRAKRPYFEVQRLIINTDLAQVLFWYPPEGLGGTVYLRSVNDRWSVADLLLYED